MYLESDWNRPEGHLYFRGQHKQSDTGDHKAQQDQHTDGLFELAGIVMVALMFLSSLVGQARSAAR
jgi:hypothetical protein